MFCLKQQQNIWYGSFPRLNNLGVRHGISTRLRGLSEPPYHSLNLALHVGDDVNHVLKNRQHFCSALNMNPEKVVTAEQVHGSKIAIVTEADIGKGAFAYSESLAATDALITAVPEIPLMLFFADCVPVIIFDPRQKVIAVCHAGWRGTVDKIAQKTILNMESNFGTAPQDCLVGIGPSVGSCCYEVDAAVAAKVQANFADWQQLLRPNDLRWQLDLWAANRAQLHEIGVLKQNILNSGICTSCNVDLFFSYRAERGLTGRIGAVVCL